MKRSINQCEEEEPPRVIFEEVVEEEETSGDNSINNSNKDPPNANEHSKSNPASQMPPPPPPPLIVDRKTDKPLLLASQVSTRRQQIVVPRGNPNEPVRTFDNYDPFPEFGQERPGRPKKDLLKYILRDRVDTLDFYKTIVNTIALKYPSIKQEVLKVFVESTNSPLARKFVIVMMISHHEWYRDYLYRKCNIERLDMFLNSMLPDIFYNMTIRFPIEPETSEYLFDYLTSIYRDYYATS